MKRLTAIVSCLAFAIASISAQEPRSNSFEDFVFKTPVAYKTSYGNDTHRITKLFDMGPYTIMEFTEEFRTLADSTDVYVHPYDFLYDPATGNRYYMVESIDIAKFPRMKYIKGKAGQTTKHNLKYMLWFERIPANVKKVEFRHAPDWDTPETCYDSTTFYDIDLTKRESLDEDYQWINTDPKADATRFFFPLTTAKFKEGADGKSTVTLDLAYRNVDQDSKHGSTTFRLDNDLTLLDPATGRKYPSGKLIGYPEGYQTWIKGWDILAFGYLFPNVDSDVDVVDVMIGDTCIIKGLHLKP